MTKFRNILVVRTDRIGDVVLTTPVIKALRKAYPMACISMMVSPSTKDLVKGNPYLNEILIDDRSGEHQGLLGFFKLVRLIRQQQFDGVFVFHTKRRYNLACFLAGVPMRIGYQNNKFGFLLNRPIKDVRHLGTKHEAQYCLDVLKSVDIESGETDFFVPTNRQAEQWAGQWLNEHHITSGEVIAIHAGSSDPAKCWSPQLFAQLIDSLHERYNFKIVLIGSKDTMARSVEIISLCKIKPLDLTGQTSLAQTISFLRRSKLLISNDSGPVHIASAVGIYVVSLFMRNDPGINPERWKPFSDKGIYLYSPQGLKIEDVLDAIEKIFSKHHQNFFPW